MKRKSFESQFNRLTRLWASGRFPAFTALKARLYLKECPEDAAGWLILGTALVRLSRYSEAQEALTKAIDLSPNDDRSFVLSQMGHLFLECGNYNQATNWYRKAFNLRPMDATNAIFLAWLLEKLGRLRKAEECLRSAIKCSEGCIQEAYCNLGLVLRNQDRFEESIECFQEAIRLDPKYKIAKESLRDADLCLRHGRAIVPKSARIPNKIKHAFGSRRLDD